MTHDKSFRKMCISAVCCGFVAVWRVVTALTPDTATKGRESGGRRLGWWLAAAGSIVWMTGPDGWWRLPD